MPDNNGYIVAAYAVTWFVVIAYAVRLHAVTRRARDLYEEASVAARGAEPPS